MRREDSKKPVYESSCPIRLAAMRECSAPAQRVALTVAQEGISGGIPTIANFVIQEGVVRDGR